ncbi:hypothetical protein KFU94_44470 [Chloroflexi bacterium TSY]|nr:hypothetical protein [Chloroflexi bacterium TSY]
MDQEAIQQNNADLNVQGVGAFSAAVRDQANRFNSNWLGKIRFVLWISERYANICLRDLWRPMRFLKQLMGKPPIEFGTDGFRPDLVDDSAPARHYTAFVFTGFWLPYPLAFIALWLWEFLGYLRYNWQWSQKDMAMGLIGIRHGREVRRHGPTVLSDLILRDLAEPGNDIRKVRPDKASSS